MFFLRIKLLILTIILVNLFNVNCGPINSTEIGNIDTSIDNATSSVPQVSLLDYQAINLLKNVNPNQLAKVSFF